MRRLPTAQKSSGFALLVAVIFMSVMLSIGLTMASLGYKQTILVSAALGSQKAFYAADTALECALYYDQRPDVFNYANGGSQATTMCDGTEVRFDPLPQSGTRPLIWTGTYSIDDDTRCAEVTVYKYNPASGRNPKTYIFSEGYDASCGTVFDPDGARFVARGLEIHY